MVRYYSRSHDDSSHLYKYDDETKKFYWMDHCWTGEGTWVLRDEPVPNIVEISEHRAMMISKGTLYTAPESNICFSGGKKIRVDNVQMLTDTLRICQQGYYIHNDQKIKLKLSPAEMSRVRVFLPDEIAALAKFKDFQHVCAVGQCEYSCENMDSFSLARKRYKDCGHVFSGTDPKEILVLNLANPVNPGGGARRGAKAQEEDLCRKSSLLLSLEGDAARRYYEYNRSLDTYMGSDAIIITPKVEIIKDENGNLLDKSVIVAVMTCAAPCLTRGMEGLSQKQYEKMVYRRIVGMLRCAAYMGYRNLVLGAFGCGAFGNDARIVSDLFYRALKEVDFNGMKEKDMFRRIDFAVWSRSSDQYNFKEFHRNFGDKNFFRNEDNAAWMHTQKSADAHRKNSESECVFFWYDYEENGCFSNWFESPFVLDDFCYSHVEQYLMAQKAKLFHDAKAYTAILKTASPKECKRLGREVEPFDQQTWDKARYQVLLTGVRAKFSQNEVLKKKLLDTGNAILAEASPYDSIFGIALDANTAATVPHDQWPGQNLLGKALMEVRAELAGGKSGKGRIRSSMFGSINRILRQRTKNPGGGRRLHLVR